MNTYTNLGEQSNMPALVHLDRVAERRARLLSHKSGITYDHAVALILANIMFKEASND